MKRYTTIIAMLIIAIAVAAVNAAAFAYRWMQITVDVKSASQARGAACVGFYSSEKQSGIEPEYLPEAGTNYNAKTYYDQLITVYEGQAVCTWNGYSLYEGITVSLPITVGSWYIKDFYGFGYYGTRDTPVPVYVWIKVEDPADESGISNAMLIFYNATTKDHVANIDLKTSGPETPTVIKLYPGQALQLDLFIDATQQVTATFKVGFYASHQGNEAPR
jgi:hypothetical protein